MSDYFLLIRYTREYAIRLLNRKAKPAASPTKRPGPMRKYQAEVLLGPLNHTELQKSLYGLLKIALNCEQAHKCK